MCVLKGDELTQAILGHASAVEGDWNDYAAWRFHDLSPTRPHPPVTLADPSTDSLIPATTPCDLLFPLDDDGHTS